MVLAQITLAGEPNAVNEAARVDTLDASLADFNVVWTTPSTDSRGSMPLGNGSTALNAWVEPSGDLVFYIARDDAFCGDLTGGDYGSYCLTKVGRLRCRFSPSPFGAGPVFQQTLRLIDGSMEVIGEGGATLRLWVDANHSVIRVEASTPKPASLVVTMESWRQEETKFTPADTILPEKDGKISWMLRSRVTPKSSVIHMTNKGNVGPLGVTTGAVAWGKGLTPTSPTTLSGEARTKHSLTVVTHTAATPTAEVFTEQLATVATQEGAEDPKAWSAHSAWWRAFWERSHIFLSGGERAHEAGQGYLLQRFKNACTSRGAYPIKFNGSLFTVDWPDTEKTKNRTADYRRWGHGYWFQNTRAIYWSMMACGDFDLMRPFFRMYRAMLDVNAAQVRELYGHGGAYFSETQCYWGGLNKVSPTDKPYYTKHYYMPILELSAMMLDYYAYTGDRAFLKDTLLPIADAGLTFYAEHFSRGPDAKLLLEPVNAAETYWKVRDPAPDIAGLHRVVGDLLALPVDAVSADARQRWLKLRSELPALPRGVVNNEETLLYYAPGQTHQGVNGENPELYAVHPYRLFGIGKPELELARTAFKLAKFTHSRTDGCWRQMAIQTALLGWPDEARKRTTTHLTNKHKEQRFPAFWTNGSDYTPDEDNGGNGMYALQLMLLQESVGKLYLLPAWPKEWDVRFRLHAPGKTVVSGEVRGGKLVSWSVEPKSRRADVILPDGMDGKPIANLYSETAFLDHLKAAPSRIEDIVGNVLDAGRVTLTRKWDGQRCAFSITNVGSEPVRLKNIILFDMAEHQLDPATPIYGEGFQKLCQFGGTLGRMASYGSYSDLRHYKIPEPDGLPTAYGMITLDFDPQRHILLGFTSCNRFIGRFSCDKKQLRVSVDPEGLELAPGETWKLEEFIAMAGENRNELLQKLAERINQNHPPLQQPALEKQTGWCTWYGVGGAGNQKILTEAATFFGTKLPRLKFMQIDEGYTVEGDLLECAPWWGNLRQTCDAIRERGLLPGLWVGPFVASIKDSKVLKQHPDWFVKGEDGMPLNSGTVSFGGWKNGPWAALDGSNPEAQKWLEHVFLTYRKDYGITYFKLDANFWGAIHGGKHFDPKATRVEAYRRGMEAVLRGAGPDAIILGCNAPMWPSFGLVNVMRTGMDVSRKFASFKARALENFSRGWQNGKLWVLDPDCVVLAGSYEKPNQPFPPNVRALYASIIHACGGMILSGDKIPDLGDAEIAILDKLAPPTGKSAIFDDLTFKTGVTDLGDRQYYYAFNWDNVSASRTLHLKQPSRLKDFWTDEDLGIHSGDYVIKSLPAQSARLLVAVPDGAVTFRMMTPTP